MNRVGKLMPRRWGTPFAGGRALCRCRILSWGRFCVVVVVVVAVANNMQNLSNVAGVCSKEIPTQASAGTSSLVDICHLYFFFFFHVGLWLGLI